MTQNPISELRQRIFLTAILLLVAFLMIVSLRSSMKSIGTGSLVLSYSLQYVHDRLHRRIGTMCTSTGCFVDANARTVCRTPRVNLLKLLAFGIVKISSSNQIRNYRG